MKTPTPQPRPLHRLQGFVLGGMACLLLAACGGLPRSAPPAQQVWDASIPHFPDVRAWSGRPSEAMERDLAQSFAQESKDDFPPRADGAVGYSHLALSGGGANGAFGAGFLNGWTSAGTRPVFKIVTGVSTGALMAPFAFVGPDYDEALRLFYTTTRTRDIFELGSVFTLLRQAAAGDSLADTRPLQLMIERHVDAQLLGRVAEAHRRGRRLYIGTVNLDAPSFVVWNMGLIATSGRADALDLFRKVMLASASIPVAFPPVLFEVEIGRGGPRHDEMHVDGGLGARVFLNGGVLDSSIVQRRGGLGGTGAQDIFVIHNGQLIPRPEPIGRTLPAIAARSIDASGRAAALGDLIRIHGYAQQATARLRWTTIPDAVQIDAAEVFDPAKMQALYDIGYRMAAGPEPWLTLPPGLRAEP
ncbi:MAG: patatin-like phospholipase family protein [Rubrivivax sp.]|nr:patatin-like phospholipase family protein [Rubrivivax sp.]